MATAEGEIILEGSQVPEEGGGGLPQLDAATFPSQLFWLAVTFGLLFLVLWRMVLPRIQSTIGERRHRIEGDLSAAERLRKESSDALSAYEAALAAARGRALTLADENRKRIAGEIDALKATADADAQSAVIEAEGRIAAKRIEAEGQVRAAAADAAAAIVERLIGKAVGSPEAEQAVAASVAKRG